MSWVQSLQRAHCYFGSNSTGQSKSHGQAHKKVGKRSKSICRKTNHQVTWQRAGLQEEWPTGNSNAILHSHSKGIRLKAEHVPSSPHSWTINSWWAKTMIIVLSLALLSTWNLKIGKRNWYSVTICWKNIENPGPGEPKKQVPGILTQKFTCVYLFSCFFSSKLNMHLSKCEIGSQYTEQTRGSGVGSLSVSSNFYASVNLWLIALAWPSESDKPISNVWKCRMYPQPAFKCQQHSCGIGLKFRYRFQPNHPL